MNKLLEFQRSVKGITKDSINPFFKSHYFDINSLLAEIRPILNELGLVISQPLTSEGGKPALRTTIYDSSDGKILETGTIVMPENSDPQKMGAIITYYRRYALQSMLCLEAEDDDADMASSRTAPVSKPAYIPPTTNHANAMQTAMKQAITSPVPTVESYGVCKDCGQPNKKYSTGKIGCSVFCWKDKKELPVIQQEEFKIEESEEISSESLNALFPN